MEQSLNGPYFDELARDKSGGGAGPFSNHIYNKDESVELEIGIDGNIIKILCRIVAAG